MVPIQQTIDGGAWPSMKPEQHKVFNGDYLFIQVTTTEKNTQINYEIAYILILCGERPDQWYLNFKHFKLWTLYADTWNKHLATPPKAIIQVKT